MTTIITSETFETMATEIGFKAVSKAVTAGDIDVEDRIDLTSDEIGLCSRMGARSRRMVRGGNARILALDLAVEARIRRNEFGGRTYMNLVYRASLADAIETALNAR